MKLCTYIYEIREISCEASQSDDLRKSTFIYRNGYASDLAALAHIVIVVVIAIVSRW